MFTGIVQHVGTVLDAAPVASGMALSIGAEQWAHRPQAGESVAVNGCCLTALAAGREDRAAPLRFDVVHETLRSSTLGELRQGDRVNLEPAVTASTALSGHIVQGHVDGIGTVERMSGGDREQRILVSVPAALRPFIVHKGSIAVDGVSLTVAAVDEQGFEVALIPTTLALTTLGGLRPGRRVNLESDYVAKIVVNWLERQARPSHGQDPPWVPPAALARSCTRA